MAWKRSASEATKRDAMQEFADRIIGELEKGVKPWVRPWDSSKCAGPQAPRNAVTGHHYSGINVLVLAMDFRAFQTGDPRYATYKQAQDHAWQVRNGERSTTVFLYKPLEIEDEQAHDGKRTVPMLRTFPVFHASQIDGIPPYKAPTIEEAPWRSEEASEIIMKNSGAIVRIGGDRAFYSPTTDHIQVPPSVAFKNAAEEACTKLHELGHWTGAPNRLNRDLSGRFGSESYAMDEIRVELASAFIAGELNIQAEIPNHASYIQNWLKPLKNDKREIFRVAADAQKIASMVLGFHPDFVLAHASRPADPVAEEQPREPIIV